MLAPRPAETHGVFGSLVAACRGWVETRRLARQTSQSFAECNSYEVERMAREAGLSTRELGLLVKAGPDAAKLLLARLAALCLHSVALSKRDPSTMRDLQRLCSNCTSKKTCQRDLIRNCDDPIWRQYCPNVGTLDALDLKRKYFSEAKA